MAELVDVLVTEWSENLSELNDLGGMMGKEVDGQEWTDGLEAVSELECKEDLHEEDLTNGDVVVGAKVGGIDASWTLDMIFNID